MSVGAVIYRLKETIDHINLCDSKTIWIDEICVDENYRIKGIGRLLIEKVKKQAKEINCNKIELNCWEFNENAMRFYEKIGLTTQRRIMEIKV